MKGTKKACPGLHMFSCFMHGVGVHGCSRPLERCEELCVPSEGLIDVTYSCWITFLRDVNCYCFIAFFMRCCKGLEQTLALSSCVLGIKTCADVCERRVNCWCWLRRGTKAGEEEASAQGFEVMGLTVLQAGQGPVRNKYAVSLSLK